MAATQPSDRHTNSNDRSVVVLKTSDVRIRGNDVFMPITIVMSQIKKPENEQFKKVEITKEMTERDVEEKLLEKFPYLRNQRFCCAAAVDNRTRLDFNGDRRIWSGSLIKRLLKGNSALYIFVDEQVPGYANMVSQSEASSRSAEATATQNRVDLDVTLVTSLHSLPIGSSVHRESDCLTQPAQSTFCVSSVLDSPKKWQDAASLEQLTTKRPPEQMTTAENESNQTFKKLRATKGVSNNTERNVAGDLNARTPLRALGIATVQGRVSEKASRSYQTEGHLQNLSYGSADMKESAHVPAQLEPLSFDCHPSLAIQETKNTTMAIPSHSHPMTTSSNVPVKYPVPQMNSPWTSEHDNHVLLQQFGNGNTQLIQPMETDTHGVNQDLNSSKSSRRWASSDKIAFSSKEPIIDDIEEAFQSPNFYLWESDSLDSEIDFSNLIALPEMDDSELTSLLSPSSVVGSLTPQASINVGLHNQKQRDNTIQMPELPNAMRTQVSHGMRGNYSDSGLGSQSSSSAPQSRNTSDIENSALEEYPIIKIRPNPVGLSGAPSCEFLGLAELFPEVESGYATVGNLDENILWEKGDKHGNGNCIPSSPKAGKQIVKIYSATGKKLAEAKLSYVDDCRHTKEECLQTVAERASQSHEELCRVMSDILIRCRPQASTKSGKTQHSGNSESSLIVQVLRFLINEAEESGLRWDSLPLLEFVAMNHDHENAAHFLEEITERYARDITPEGRERIDLSELLAAINASREEDEATDSSDGRNDSDSSYDGDVESLLCDSEEPTSDSEHDHSDMLRKAFATGNEIQMGGNNAETDERVILNLQSGYLSGAQIGEKETQPTHSRLKDSTVSVKEIVITERVSDQPFPTSSDSVLPFGKNGKFSRKAIAIKQREKDSKLPQGEYRISRIREHFNCEFPNLTSMKSVRQPIICFLLTTESVNRCLSTMEDRWRIQLQLQRLSGRMTMSPFSMLFQAMHIKPEEALKSLSADADLSSPSDNTSKARCKPFDSPLPSNDSTPSDVVALTSIYRPSGKILLSFVLDRKGFFPPESLLEDEDCELLMECWKWRRSKKNFLAEKLIEIKARSEIPAQERLATGKTSLKKCLGGELFNSNEGSTEEAEADLLFRVLEELKENFWKIYSQKPSTKEMDQSPKKPQDKPRVSKHPENKGTLGQRLFENVNDDKDDIQRESGDLSGDLESVVSVSFSSEVARYSDTSVPALPVTVLGGEWGSSAGRWLSTKKREVVIHFSNHSAVKGSLLVPEGACNTEEIREADGYGITIVEAKEPGAYDCLHWSIIPPEVHFVDFGVGQGVKLGRQVQFIRDSPQFSNCKWVPEVHTAPEELSRYKCYSDPISKGETKHESEVELCKLADLVVPVGPRLKEAFYSHLQRCRKDEDVLSITPGLFQREFGNLVEKQDPNEDGELKVLLFGLGDDEHFELKGHDIAAKVFCDQRLKNKPYHLIFVGAAEGKQEEVRGKFLQCDNAEAQLTVRKLIQNRDRVKDLLCEAGLAIMPSKSEGFGLFALEALSSGLPILEGSRSGCAEELGNVPRGHTCNVNSDETAEWAKAIEAVRIRPRMRLQGIKLLRSSYREMYNWKEQSEALVNRMWKMGHGMTPIQFDCSSQFSDDIIPSPPLSGTEHLTSVDEDVVLKSSSNSTNSREKLASILEELEAENKRLYETNEVLRKLRKALVELVRHLEILAGRNEKKLHSYRQMETTENILKLESDLLRKDQEILTLRNESVDLSCGVCKLRNELETELTELRTSKTPEHDRVAEVVDGRSDSTGSTLLISDVNFELAVNSKSTESFLEKPDKSEFVGDSQMDRNQPSKEQIQQLLIVIDVPQSKKSRMADRNGKLCQILKTPEARSRSPFRLCRSETECLQQEVNIKSAEANTVRKYAPFCSKKANELRSEMAAHRENEACLEKRLYDLEKESAQVRKEMRNGMLEFSELKEKTESVEKKTVDASCVVDRLKEIIRFINDVSTLQREPNVHIDKMSGCLGLDEKGVQQTVTQLHVSVESNDISTQTKESGSEVSSKLSEVFLSSSPFPFRLLPDKEGFLNPIDVSVIRENKTEILHLHDGLNAKVLANSDKACIPKVDDERSGEVHTRAALKNVAVGPKNTSGLPRLSKAERVKFSSFLSICNRTTKNDGRSSGDGNDLCLLYENLEGKLSWLSCELLTKENESTDFLSERTQLQNELEECENGLTVCLHCNCKVSPELEQNRKRLKGGLLSQAQDTSRLESEICEFMECRQRLEGELDLIKGQITNLEDELGCYINREMHWTEARRGRKGNY